MRLGREVEDASRVSSFINEVNRYMNGWDETRKSVNEFRTEKEDEDVATGPHNHGAQDFVLARRKEQRERE